MEYLQQALIELAQKYRSLEQENRQLRKQLKVNDMSLPVPIPSEPDTDPDQGARIQFPWITEYMVRFFFSMFWGRMDVYARRGKNGGTTAHPFIACDFEMWNDVAFRYRIIEKFLSHSH